ncbi:hypothetical protein [Cellulomonas sp. S1-8]|uniref:hypothetical protein n=1 Tax=Cellulomonas sp. S1-8 TaxID=2904790 RepID=UPI0022432959|nr:hypothetical protein [Cellulomonas sp. S1-8]UZN02189.1 hypothetical protein OKX07_13970 [Cellulomonas sp. S1-8]
MVDEPEYAQVAAALAVLAGIAAADAVCGHALGQYSRAQGHREAIDLLTSVDETLAKQLGLLLAQKDNAHYSPRAMSAVTVTQLVRAAGHLVEQMDARLTGG